MDLNTLLEHALQYARMGWSVVPGHQVLRGRCTCKKGKECDSPGKHPRIAWTEFQERKATEEEIRQWWTRWPRASICVITGAVSGIIVLDIDGPEGVRALKDGKYSVDATVISKTGGGGWHYVYLHPGGDCRNFASKIGATILPKVDFRGDGGLIIAPPSMHKSGNRYEWQAGPDMIDPAPAPGWLVKLIREQFKTQRGSKQAEPAGETIPEGQRDQTLTSLAGSMRRRGMVAEEIFQSLMAVNANRCRPPLAESQVRKIANSVSRYEPGAPDKGREDKGQDSSFILPIRNRTDMGNAKRLVARHGNRILYCHPWKEWLTWDGIRWQRDDTAAIMRLAKDTVQQIGAEAAQITDEDERKEMLKWAFKSEGRSLLRNMIELAESEEGIPVLPAQLDSNPWLLTVLNGTLNLRTGELRPHSQKDLITKLAPVVYNPGAKSPLWEGFLERILPDPDLRRYVQKAAGHSMTGDVSEELLHFPYGPTATGKGTFLGSIVNHLGDYAVIADFSTFLERDTRSGQARSDLVALVGKRFVVSQETKRGERLAEGLLKNLTGGQSDKISMREMYGKTFEAVPTWHLWLSANHRPNVSADDAAIWRRLRQLPFDQQIPKEERDPTVKKRLMDAASGPAILNWLLEGCLLWQKEGLEPPKAVLDATREYQEEVDPLTDFLEDCCITGPGFQVSNRQIWDAYRQWAQGQGLRYPLGRKGFTQALYGRGLIQATPEKTRVWLGISLLVDSGQKQGRDTSDTSDTYSQQKRASVAFAGESGNQVSQVSQVSDEAAATSEEDEIEEFRP